MTTNTTGNLNLSATIAADLDAAASMPSITPQSLKFKSIGEKHRLIFISITTWNEVNQQTGETVVKEAANFLKPSTNSIVFNQGVQLVRQMRDFRPGVAVEVELMEMKPNKKNGQTYLYKITPLAVPVYDLRAVFGFAPVVGLPAPSPDRQPDAATAPVDVAETVDAAPTNAVAYDHNAAREAVFGSADIPF